MLKIIFIFLVCINSFAADRSRTIFTKNDDITEVKTSLGIATKLLFSQNPTDTPIIGDVSAFRIEAIPKGYAIKPIRYGAKTNLFVTVGSRHFAIILNTVPHSLADFIVYAKEPLTVKGKDRETFNFIKTFSKGGLTVTTKKIIRTKKSYVIVYFEIKTEDRTAFEFSDIKLMQNGKLGPMHTVLLSQKVSNWNKPIQGAVAFHISDLKAGFPVLLQFESRDVVKILVPQNVLWKGRGE